MLVYKYESVRNKKDRLVKTLEALWSECAFESANIVHMKGEGNGFHCLFMLILSLSFTFKWEMWGSIRVHK